jgi:hypothetical protein
MGNGAVAEIGGWRDGEGQQHPGIYLHESSTTLNLWGGL